MNVFDVERAKSCVSTFDDPVFVHRVYSEKGLTIEFKVFFVKNILNASSSQLTNTLTVLFEMISKLSSTVIPNQVAANNRNTLNQIRIFFPLECERGTLIFLRDLDRLVEEGFDQGGESFRTVEELNEI